MGLFVIKQQKSDPRCLMLMKLELHHNTWEGKKTNINFFQTYTQFLAEEYLKVNTKIYAGVFFIPSGSVFFSCSGFRLFVTQLLEMRFLLGRMCHNRIVPMHRAVQACALC